MDIRFRNHAGIYCKYCGYKQPLVPVCYAGIMTGTRCSFKPRYEGALEDAEKEIAALKKKAGDEE